MRCRASLLLLAALSSACALGSGPMAGPPSTTNLATRLMSQDLQSTVELALDDAARRVKLDRATLKVINAERVTWSDGALGCPQPGMMYTQALEPGYRIRIQAGAEVLDYHAGSQGQLILCPAGRSVDPLPLESK